VSFAVVGIRYYAALSCSDRTAEWGCDVHALAGVRALYFPVGPQLAPKGARVEAVSSEEKPFRTRLDGL